MTEVFEDEALKSLTRIVEFDVNDLPQKERLGQELAFDGAVEPAQRIIELFRQLPFSALTYFPSDIQNDIKKQADAFYSQLESITKFDSSSVQPKQNRDKLIEELTKSYGYYFGKLHSSISYASSRTHNHSAMEIEGRAAVQAVKDQQAQLQNSGDEATKILNQIRATAAEQGVSQQAIYFDNESTFHSDESEKWKKYTIFTSIGLVVFALLSAFAYKFTWINPSTTYETIQFVVGKVLIFGSILFMLVLCARNFMSHKHNAIINKHRQNALRTFNALVEATSDEESKDVILTHAASCIFTPQDTGYTKSHVPQSGAQGTSLLGFFSHLGRGYTQSGQ